MREREPDVWDIQVSAGRDPGTGKRRRLTRRVHGSEKDAERALTALQHEADTGKHGGTMASCATVIERWWDLYRDELSPTTARRYRQIIDGHLLPRWGTSRINELDISELSAWFRSLHRAGLAPATVRQIRAVFRRALEEAVRWEWIDTNPIKKSTTVPVPRHRLEATAPAVVLRLFHAAIDLDEDFGVWVYVAATTGMRRSEMAGLLWRDVDLDGGKLVVRRAIVQVGRDLVVKATKTEDSARRMRLDADTLKVLRAHRARVEPLAPGGVFGEEALVWSTSPDGSEAVSPDAITQTWRRLCKREDVKGVRLHDLRHFMATQAITAGMDIARVSQRLGHSQISTTLNIYTDHVEAADQEIADHMGSILRPPTEKDDDGEAA